MSAPIAPSQWPESAAGCGPPMITRPSFWRRDCERLLSVPCPRSRLFPERTQVFFREVIADLFV
jgi:hypothetical protein